MSAPTAKDVRIAVLYPAEEIAARVRALAGEIAGTAGRNPLVIPVLKGSFIFAADLLRALHEAGVEPDMDFISLSSYGAGTHSLGEVRIVRDTETVVSGRDVILVDDILESGRTLAFAKDLMAARGARSVRTCVLLRKPGKLAVELEADFVGFDCPDRFVLGYGMDVAHAYRQLPFVGYVER
ncbi:hypoxanthine phosphoribosyltransferase [Parvibaculum sp.]|uniref:hypoxanthine phosphoribosyltransferase n=1 Tax=Parvibaculum sp. TaxID=2024848 RepID=UPI002725D505|nr:hypoxanthine phosphoribosyltransferase [Parvibaculum sp.]MDO9125304.1 hypoxanthine phosphoribosyltransferase [Parvibaculum sp.]MDP1625763.1 hypoxanthine phosphoribosyltransferase [Parvibaculum sp.]MDP2149126.1 hypoxanthine phosphoribosyltransferase [Parvibaculum sp.]MDP3328335.1 hypoxanthine phosphoribosyltransferase [Parvibaculum sp.]